MKKSKNIIKLDPVYKFEENTYSEIDLSGLDELKTIDLIECQNKFSRGGKVDALIEMNIDYCMLIASRVTGKPIEFFYNLPAKYSTVIKNRVSGFLLGAV